MIADLPAYSPISPSFDRNRLTRSMSQGSVPVSGNGVQAEKSAPATDDPDSVTTSADIGSLPAAAIGFGLNQAGLPGYAVSGINAAMTSSNLSQLQDSLLSSLTGTLGGAAVNAVAPGIPGIASVGGALASEATKSNPNYGAAAVSSGIKAGASVAGGMLLGPIGAMVAGALAGYATKTSLDDGWLGDMTDARSREKERDTIEDAFDLSASDTKGLASTQGMMDAFGISYNTLWRRIQEGKIKAYKPGQTILVDLEDGDSWWRSSGEKLIKVGSRRKRRVG